MFDPSLVVQSAASSFNNVAIAAPTFFWSAVLMLPVFALVYYFGNSVLSKIKGVGALFPKWQGFDFLFFVEAFVLAWIVLLAGNYAVLRDTLTWMPYVIAVILFIVTAGFCQKLRGASTLMPERMQGVKWGKLLAVIVFALVVLVVGLSGYPSWWGLILQAGAFVSGIVFGRFWHRSITSVSLMSVILFTLTTLILMQPEFFRFGQLGNLTIIHLFFIILTGLTAVALLAIRNFKPHSRISDSFFIKLKWVFRILIGLCVVLFVLTESVPVFLALAGLFFVSSVLSVWHAQSISDSLAAKLWGLLLCCFGIITMVPMITIIGLLYWANQPRSSLFKAAGFLL